MSEPVTTEQYVAERTRRWKAENLLAEYEQLVDDAREAIAEAARLREEVKVLRERHNKELLDLAYELERGHWSKLDSQWGPRLIEHVRALAQQEGENL